MKGIFSKFSHYVMVFIQLICSAVKELTYEVTKHIIREVNKIAEILLRKRGE